MRIYQFYQEDDNINKDFKLMFLIMDDTFTKGTSCIFRKGIPVIDWNATTTGGLLWMDRDEKIFNTFRYKDTI